MAFDKTPTSWIAGIVVDGTFLKIPLASLPQITASEVTGTGADIRKVLFAILDKVATAFAEKAEADRPTKFTATRSTSLPSEYSNSLTRSYAFTTQLDFSGVEVVAED